MKEWFVVNTKPRNDDRAAKNLSVGNIEILAPKLRLKKYKDGRVRQVTEPLFPNYIFARFDPIHEYHLVKYTRGVNTVVKFNGVIAPLKSEVVDFIRSRLVNGVATIEERSFSNGEKVFIKDGPFKGLNAVFEKELPGHERVAILLNDVNYYARMQVDKNLLESAGT